MKIYEFVSISKNLNYQFNLTKGKHLIHISTIDDKYTLTDTINIIDYSQLYDLSIRYNYKPPLKEHLDYINQKLKTEKYKGKYSEEQKKLFLGMLKPIMNPLIDILLLIFGKNLYFNRKDINGTQ